MDNTDVKILRLLQLNARITASESVAKSTFLYLQ